MQTQRFPVLHIPSFKQQLLKWGSCFNSFLFLDNHGYTGKWNRIEWLAAVDAADVYTASANGNALAGWQLFLEKWQGHWQFGHLGYDLKNEIEPGLASELQDPIGFSDIGFFIPRWVICGMGDAVEIICQQDGLSPLEIFSRIANTDATAPLAVSGPIHFAASQSRDSYLKKIEQIRSHIRRGDCYELNFCMHFHANEAECNPLHLYRQLSRQSPNPFSSFYRQQDAYAVCASPERYLMRVGNTIRSQPIKGTIARGQNPTDDKARRQTLMQSAKDRAENVMVVDLVRNDLSRVCVEGTVAVEELFGIYPYPSVYQMISTVAGQLRTEMALPEIVSATFPMGSMTGAPKRRVMEFIDQFEGARRGLFSGAIGYISPQQDFDFNVVIRSILMNTERQTMHYAVGGGITWQSRAEEEWDECLLKASAIRKVLGIS